MVKLIQIERLSPRIEGMLYKCKFEEQWLLLDEVTTLTIPSCTADAFAGCQKSQSGQ